MNEERQTKFFDELLHDIPMNNSFLPIFHSCQGMDFKRIIEAKTLSATMCSVFNQRLLYLFYGRPAYKSSDHSSSNDMSSLPVSIILKIDCIADTDIVRIAPFDTGAFNANLFKAYINPKITMSDFFMTPVKNSVRKIVSYFFGTNLNYYMGDPKREKKFKPMEFEIESYFRLVNSDEHKIADDRKGTIEIQIQKNLELIPGTIEAIIIPQHFLAAEYIQNFIIKELGAKVITYRSYAIPSPYHYSSMLDKALEYLKEKKYVQE